MDGSNATLEFKLKELEAKINATRLPADLAAKLKEEISVLEVSLKGESSFLNFENFSNYVNYVLSLPFYRETRDILDIERAKQVLEKNHHGLKAAKDVILEYLASMILNIKNQNNTSRSPIICLLGLAGTGKTTLASSIAESLGRRFERIPFGGMGDAADLRGKSRVVTDAEPGLVIKSLINAQSRNCVLLLDELDRITNEGRKDIMGVLIELLDPEQNKSFLDHYIGYPFDLSKVLFVATANNTTNVATAVLDRLQIIQLPSYTDEEKTFIAEKYLFPKIMKQTGLTPQQLIISEQVWPNIIRPLGFDSGIRSLERTIEGICRKAAIMIVEKQSQAITVTPENVKGFLPT
jgi:ATP-dependent Lon protease